MSALRQAIGAAYPLPAMDPDTVRSISAGLARIERKEKAERIAAPMRELFDMLAQGEVFELDGVSVMHNRRGRRALPVGDDLVGGKWRWLG